MSCRSACNLSCWHQDQQMAPLPTTFSHQVLLPRTWALFDLLLQHPGIRALAREDTHKILAFSRSFIK
ncbi:hypothetical protein RRG08_043033 [Elysia crispata]|uniref:Uncharacterized protein n=1 Tax=Elysia crispata TaxID=231223 RepID=A0AAE1CPR3_9GAST|nr:hypothetical protein RRG08_043033 [Elysia crispata]